jgi:hypothetical protein
LVEERAKEDEEFAAALHAAARMGIQPAADGPSADLEIRSLKMTREFVRLRSVFLGMAIFFSLVPLSFVYSTQAGFRWLVWETSAGLGYASLALAAASWVAWYSMNRQVKRAGL